MSASGGFTPPEFPSGIPQVANKEPSSVAHGVSPGVAVGILAGVLVLGLITVFAVGHTSSGRTTLTALPGPTRAVHGYAPSASHSPTPSATATATATTTAAAAAPRSASTGAASAPAGSASSDPESTDPAGSGVPTTGDTQTQDPYSSPTVIADTPEFTVGECVDTSGTGSGFSVSEAGCTNADYKIIYAFQNETGDINTDMSQCYTVNGNDDEFENGDAAEGYTLYCLNSLTGEYSPRRADVDNCLDSTAQYEVDCTSSKAAWIVIGRLNGTTDTKGCSEFGSYDNSYFWTSSPPFVLCVDKYTH